jgi:hypothetical protein
MEDGCPAAAAAHPGESRLEPRVAETRNGARREPRDALPYLLLLAVQDTQPR